MSKVDVAICAYGKPYSTAVTISSLVEHSQQWIGRIFLQEEKEQPYGETIEYLSRCFPGVDVVQYVPSVHIGISSLDFTSVKSDEAYRLSLRYQYAWEASTRDFLFVAHNDCLFTSDIIGDLLSAAGDKFSGVGSIGQCWNCPANYAGLCDGDRHETYRPTFEEVTRLLLEFPGPRTSIDGMDPESPMPLPECRLNEFACLISLRATRSAVMPLGSVVPFGSLTTDTGTAWFRGLRLIGHRFLNRLSGIKHAPFSPVGNGHSSTLSRSLYDQEESAARLFLKEHYPTTFDRLDVLRTVARNLRGFDQSA